MSFLKAIPLVVLAGALPALGHLPWSPWWLQWLAFVPLLWLIGKRDPAAAFGLGWASGTVWYMIGGAWIEAAIPRFVPLPAPAVWLAFLALCAYHGLMFGLIAGLARLVGRVLERRGTDPFAALAVSAAPALACVEGYFPALLPVYLAGTQVPHLPVIQAMELLGMGAVSWLLALFNVGLYAALRSGLEARSGGKGRTRWGLLALAVAAASLNEGYGRIRMRQTDALSADAVAQGRRLKVAVVQASIPVGPEFDEARFKTSLEAYNGLSREAAGLGAELVVWPQNAYERRLSMRRLRSALYEPASGGRPLGERWKAEGGAPVHTLLGAPVEVAYDRKDGTRSVRSHFVAILRGPGGEFLGAAAKRFPVPFTEYVPVWPGCPLLRPFFGGMRRLWGGPQPVLSTAGGARLGAYICYDAVDPRSAAELSAAGAELLVDLGSDDMSGDLAVEPVQHLRHAILRAVENRKYLVRAMTTGISGVVDPAGRLASSLGMGEKGFIVEEVALLPGRTPQVRAGRFLYHLGAAVLLAAGLCGLFRRRPEAEA